MNSSKKIIADMSIAKPLPNGCGLTGMIFNKVSNIRSIRENHFWYFGNNAFL
jgi:hypothetical protein